MIFFLDFSTYSHDAERDFKGVWDHRDEIFRSFGEIFLIFQGLDYLFVKLEHLP